MSPSKRRSPPDCICNGLYPLCAVCLIKTVCQLRQDHPLTLSIAMIKRRCGDVTGREAAILAEASKLYQVRAL